MSDGEKLFPWEFPPWDAWPVKNPVPEGCTCDYEWERAICDAEFTTSLTRKDPNCPLHGVG